MTFVSRNLGDARITRAESSSSYAAIENAGKRYFLFTCAIMAAVLAGFAFHFVPGYPAADRGALGLTIFLFGSALAFFVAAVRR